MTIAVRPDADPDAALALTRLGLTRTQAEVFLFLLAYTCRHGYQPSYADCEAAFGFSSHTGVQCHLRALERKGWVRMEPGRARAVEFRRGGDGGPFRGFREEDR